MAAVNTHIEGRHIRSISCDGVNISRKDAENLVKLIKPFLANVNLIPYNEVDGLLYNSQPQPVKQFILPRPGLNVTMNMAAISQPVDIGGEASLMGTGISLINRGQLFGPSRQFRVDYERHSNRYGQY